MRWLIWIGRGFIVTTVGLYGLATVTGYRWSDAERERVDPTVRSSPGGYRSFHFWHAGHSGGK